MGQEFRFDRLSAVFSRRLDRRFHLFKQLFCIEPQMLFTPVENLAIDHHRIYVARSAAVEKLFEGFGGKVEASYWFPGNLEWDGMLIVQLPDEVTGQAIALTTRATGNFTRNASVPLMNAEEYKAAMDKAKSVKSGYTAPTATK